MTKGTKSLLFGIHQFIWHPLTVAMAWRVLYGKWPSWRECVCIAVHDLGYWGCEHMDDGDGLDHPRLGASIALCVLGREYWELAIAHSRHYAARFYLTPSKLCWADKACVMFYPQWLYLGMARLTGELEEYRMASVPAGFPQSGSDEEWFEWFRLYTLELVAKARHADTLGWRITQPDKERL